MSSYSTGRLATIAAALMVIGALVIFLGVDWLGGLLVVAGVVVAFVLLLRFVNDEFS